MSDSPGRIRNRNSNPPSPNPNPNPNSKPPPPLTKRGRTLSLPDVWFKDQSLKHVVWKMHLRSLSTTPSPPSSDSDFSLLGFQSPLDPITRPDCTSLLSDELLLQVFSRLPSSQYISNSLVCKRWLYIHGRLVQSIKLNEWSFLNSGRIFTRFPNLVEIGILNACFVTPRNSGIVLTHKYLSIHIGTDYTDYGMFIEGSRILPSDFIDCGLEMIAKQYSNLRRIVVFNASETGLLSISGKCETLQELELHCCGDFALNGISGCRNLQVVKLVACVDGFYNTVVSDIGLTILAQGCSRLVKLELCGCEGSYDGIKAIGQCCQMLGELTISDHRMDGGWLAALSFCVNLKTLTMKSCKSIDSSPGLVEHLGSCPTLEELHLQQCQMRDKPGLKALFLVCDAVREIVFQNCWGLEDEVFATASVCRRVKLVSLEGCSSLTTGGLEAVILNWKDLQRLRVMSCNKIKDGEVSPALASLFSVLKELKWRPDSKSLVSSSLAGTGVGNKGGRFFKGMKG
ncbi:F-box protein At5g51370-like [Mercurialis annua]|uniref:F-box protein At5g51370-like n=1 Tax=Mercurialis annua TaxID=3986 RepID=UPI00215E476D|nr:F-box protein At5g51370-like [Mercurialis annua]XP_050238711.1 F-box protein At5g51370-like [Mercurialis annua]